jgi:hypothetical protein
MLPRHHLLGVCILFLCLLSSCAPAASIRNAVEPTVTRQVSSPTPFQPGATNPSLLTQAAPPARPTFTPYPITQLGAGMQSMPEVAAPSGEVAPSPLSYNPLTGLLPADPSLLNRRPLVIKISNYPRAIRPQYGLNSADVVYEYYIEWLDTRFVGVFYGNDAKQIGPVRSGRYFDEHITRMYHGYYVFNFADPREFNYFLGGDLQQFVVVPGGADCPPFYQVRVSTLIRDVRHYETYFDSTRFSDCLARKNADNQRQPLRGGFFSATVPVGGSAVARIFSHYSKCDYNYWEYNPDNSRYLRYQEVSRIQTPAHLEDCSDNPETYAPLIDALSGKQVATDNVVELFVSHTFANQNEQEDEIYHINLVDSGNAFVFRDGFGYPARWIRTDIDQPLVLTTPDGVPIYLRPGNTFFQVMGETSEDWSDGSDWHFDFQTP